MQLDSKKVLKNLKKKGFQERKGDHIYLDYVTSSGKRTHITTKISHGQKHEIYDVLISLMSKQCELDKTDFLNLVNCPLKRESYEKILERKEII